MTEHVAERDAPRAAGHLKHGLLSAAVLTVLGAGAVASVPDLAELRERVASAAPGWIALAVALELLSCWSFVHTFRLVFPCITPRDSARIAWSEMAFGAVVPAGGAGGLAAGAWILHVKGLSLRDAAERSAVLFLLTSAVNAVVLAAAGFAVAAHVLPGPRPFLLGFVPASVAVLGVAGFVLLARPLPVWLRDRPRLGRWASVTGRAVRRTQAVVRSGDWRLTAAGGYLLFDIAVLWACFEAFGASPLAGPLVLAYQIGYLANLLPIPGGVGVLDGGMIGALLLYGAPAAPTAAAVLSYHAIALWIPALIGTARFALLRRTLYEPLPGASCA